MTDAKETNNQDSSNFYIPNLTEQSKQQQINEINKSNQTQNKKDYCGFVFSFGMICFSIGVTCYNFRVLGCFHNDAVSFIFGSAFSGLGQFIAGILQYIRGEPSSVFLVFGMSGICNMILQYALNNNWYTPPSTKDMGWYNLFWFFSFTAVTLGSFNTGYFGGINLVVSCISSFITAISNFCESDAGCKVAAVVGVISGVMGYYTAIQSYLCEMYGKDKVFLPMF